MPKTSRTPGSGSRTPTTPPVVLALAIAISTAIGAVADAQEAESRPYPTFGSIERIDTRLDALIPPGAEMQRLATGFEWSEGPVWLPEEGALLFSDIPRNTVFRWHPGDGLSVFLKPSGYTGSAAFTGQEPGSNGLLLDPRGRLILCQHGDRRVSRLEDGEFVTLADEYDGKRLNSPNDAVFDDEGNLYFTDPPYGLPGNVNDPAKELDFQGVYLLRKSGELVLLTKEMSRPNGIGLSPDGKTLYVANSDPERPIWMAYTVQDDGTIADGRVFADASAFMEDYKGLPDGLAVDSAGNVFATGPGGVHILAPDGTRLGLILTGEATANCTFGGDDRSTLYITADMHLGRVETATTGLPPASQR